MFFRPNFCANCGEKIERAEWSVWTSRRFCYVCESEYKGHDLIPRFIVGLGIMIGIFGIGSYLKSGPPAPGPAAVREPRRIASQGVLPKTASNVENVEQQRPVEPPQNESAAVKSTVLQPMEARKVPSAPAARPVVAEQGYFCGAETKKGTPCSRRVKGNVRCFQHQGMPAMLAAEKLRIN
jgi:hypothetical protein